MSEELPVRKNLRLKNYDYSENGAYFLTICIKDRHELLGMITEDIIADAPVGDTVLSVPPPEGIVGTTGQRDTPVGDAVLSVPPPEGIVGTTGQRDTPVGDAVLSVPPPEGIVGTAGHRNAPVGDAVLSVPQTPHIQLTEIGESVKVFLENMNTANESLQLDHYVIMPNHVHLLIMINGGTQKPGTQRTASPTPTSPTSAVIPQIVHGMKSCTTRFIGESIWQRSYHDHIVRNEKEYNKIWNYINTNVQNWQEDCFYNKNSKHNSF